MRISDWSSDVCSFDLAWSVYDPKQANALLDELGMIWKDADGIRHLPDGRRAELVIETAEVDPAETDALEIIAAQWKKIGIAAVARAQPRQAARQRVGAGVTVQRSEEPTIGLQALM